MTERKNDFMEIVDFMICSGELSKFNYVIVKNSIQNVQELKEMGCSDEEILTMQTDDPDELNVLDVLVQKGYRYVPNKGAFVL